MVGSDTPDDSTTPSLEGLAAMTAQIFNFPSQPTTVVKGIAAPMASDYVEVAQRLTASAAIRGYDLSRLARAVTAAADIAEREARAAEITEVKREAGYTAPVITPQPEDRVVDKFRGAKYSSGRDVVEIAKLLRKDIKEARKTTLVMLPAHTTISVTTSRYSMGCSLTVRVKGLFEAEKWNDGDCRNGRTSLCLNIMEACTELMNAYKRDNSASTLSDYYDVNFSGSVVVD